MTFCTACASPIATPNQSCPTCGALHTPAVALHGSPFLRDAPAKQSILIRVLYMAPVLLLFAVAAGLVQRHAAQEQWLESAYAAAQDAARSGDMVAAREGFMAIIGYRDAAEQVHDIDTVLEPLEAAYLDGIQAIEGGDYAAAVDLLAPVARAGTRASRYRDTPRRCAPSPRRRAAARRRRCPRLLATGQPQSKRCANWLRSMHLMTALAVGWVCYNASMARSYSATIARSGWWRRMEANLVSLPMRYTSSGRFGVPIGRRSHSWRLILTTRWATSPSTA